MASIDQSLSEEGLLRRIRSEYLEMPGLNLTCAQAQRLWSLDERTCASLLESLVDAKFLQRNANGQYRRLSDSGVHHFRVRMTRAKIDLERWGQRPGRMPHTR